MVNYEGPYEAIPADIVPLDAPGISSAERHNFRVISDVAVQDSSRIERIKMRFLESRIQDPASFRSVDRDAFRKKALIVSAIAGASLLVGVALENILGND